MKAEITLGFEMPAEVAPRWSTVALELLPFSPQPRNLLFDEIPTLSGRLRFRMTTEEAAAWFPAATIWLGARLVRGLAATSHLVGMICPGLHSIYSELSMRSSGVSGLDEDCLAFRVTKADRRYSLAIEDIASIDFTGTVTAFVRTPPVAQASTQSLAGTIASDEFAGSMALIVGGSRGLGELTAKIVATGGGRVAITWQSGEADALRVAEEIRAGGGSCQTLRYDSREPAATQLAALEEAPTHAYYFATPPISRPRSEIYAAHRFEDFLKVYVDGFWQLMQALRARRRTISVFYPSSVFVSERPPGLTEYAMAKAAGESLCADINAQMAPAHVTVKRLPRLPTDQTTSLTSVQMVNPLEVMLPIVREMHARSVDGRL